MDSYYDWVRLAQSVKLEAYDVLSGGVLFYTPFDVEAKAREVADTLNKSPVALDVLLWMLWIANTGKYNYMYVFEPKASLTSL